MRQRRILPVFAVLMLGFLAVSARLVKLQGVEADMWLRESERSTVRFSSLPFDRGWITDRKGRPLACTEDVRDLTFRYRGWRRNTVAGQANHAWVILGRPRETVPDAIDNAAQLVSALGDVRVDEIAALPSRGHRRDLGFYLARLLGDDLWDDVTDRLQTDRPAAKPLRELTGYERMLARTQARARREQEALRSLAWASGLLVENLIEDMERAAVRADKRVAAGLASEQGETRDVYRREQQLHAEFDDDPSRLVRRVSFDTHTLVEIKQAELGGFGIQTTRSSSPVHWGISSTPHPCRQQPTATI